MIYFDNSATTKPYPEALDTFLKVAQNYYANPSSIHRLGSQSEELLKRSRQQAANLLQVSDKDIIFTSGGSEGNNLAIKGIANYYKDRGKHIITTEIEHASSYLACKQLEKEGYEVTYLPVDNEGKISLDQLKQALRKDTILVSIIHVNNEVGTIQPISEVAALLQDKPTTLLHVDHVQGVGKVPLDLSQGNIDLCTISGHKFHGPKGTGLLFVRHGVTLSPLIAGGSQEQNRRAGTENLPGIAAMVKALRITLELKETHSRELKRHKEKLIQGLSSIEGITFHTPKNGSAPHIINISVKGLKAEVLVHALEEKEVYVSTKSACSSKDQQASRILLAMGVSDSDAKQAIRLSLSYQTTAEEVEQFLKIFKTQVEDLRQVMRS
ncbi:aminotransferase class V-fold PLP-dependent enzyme [Terrilactibacillus sp. BCM23-1]|uniref:Aminotransferase class V-fold PLP-dependent enzyme n=1 Tax=Terrilactibacillus tamarindi TaxID=2599694 RepID=A0A6N8CVV3_9BACI|nr:cysteine desulfurase family protein [Terrilactibacillus tamarindi]MTT32516.1 aminotransferase class V-fold PLP-dependent enzyme [Terrilactibacillus tamarindi]